MRTILNLWQQSSHIPTGISDLRCQFIPLLMVSDVLPYGYVPAIVRIKGICRAGPGSNSRKCYSLLSSCPVVGRIVSLDR